MLSRKELEEGKPSSPSVYSAYKRPDKVNSLAFAGQQATSSVSHKENTYKTGGGRMSV